MAAKRGSGESRAGLVIFLVLFILVSIGLGVTTYYGYEEANNQKKAAEDEKKKADQWTKNANYWKFLALTYRAYIGLPATKDPKADDLGTLRGQFDPLYTATQDINKEDHKKSIFTDWGDQNEKKKWVAEAGKPVETYQEQISKLEGQVKDLKVSLKTAEDKALSLDQEVKAKERELKDSQLTYANNLAAKDTANSTEIARKDEVIKMMVAQLEKKLDPKLAELETQRKEIDAVKKDNERLTGLLKKSNEELRKSKDELAGIRAAPEDIDITKIAPENLAHVERIDRNGDTVYISLGSADSLRRQTTFSIYGKGVDGRPLKQPKGKLEVLRITGEHTAQCQITDLTDERRDPVLPGDFIYNPAWRSNHRQHVVLIGIMDLTGDNRDSTQQMIRDLKGQDIEVDAYMDLRSYKLKKPNSPDEGTITRDTDMLIVGPVPSSGPKGLIGGKEDAKSTDMITAMQGYQKAANEMGVRIVRLNNFLESSGFVLPRSAAPEAGKIDFHRSLDSAGSPVKKPTEPMK